LEENNMRRILAGAICAMALVVHPLAGLAGEIAPGDVAFVDMKVAASLTGTPGNPEEGVKAFANRGLGNCLACHAVKSLSKEQFHGDVAPALDGVADRWSPEELRAIVVDSKQFFTKDTMMPGFYSLNVGINVRKDLVGKTILTAQQVEDVVAFLATLKE
jgi:sulfur-oxidizing protein SoxX